MGIGAFLVAAVIAGLAWNSRDRSPVMANPHDQR
jgi:hypothetical protein